jgi:hypothetical protein
MFESRVWVGPALFFTVCLGACASRDSSADLQKALSLHVVEAPAVVIPGREIEVRFAVQNLTDIALPLCSANGVSTYLQSAITADVWPIVIHGWTTDTYCSGPFQLAAGEHIIFVERGVIRRDLPAGPRLLVGKICLQCDPRTRSRCLEHSLMCVRRYRCSRRGNVVLGAA